MKWFLLVVAILASVFTFVLMSDHAHAMVWVGSGYLVAAYVFIPRKPQIGWACSFTGNLLYLYPIALLHRVDLMVVPTVFTALSFYNVWNELT